MAFGVDVPEAIERAMSYRDRRPPQGLGEKAMAAAATWHWTHSNGPLDECVELGLGALSGGELIAADGGLLPVYALIPLILGDREEVMDAWEQMLAARSPQRFDVRDHDDPALARLHALSPRRPARGREVPARCGRELPRVRLRRAGTTYVGAHLAAILTERGDLAGASARRSGNPDPGAVDAARYWLQAKMGCCWPRASPRRSSRSPTSCLAGCPG